MNALDSTLALEKTFSWADGELFYRHWPAARSTKSTKATEPSQLQKIIFIFHRGHEHSGRMLELAESLGFDSEEGVGDTHVIAWDERGHGKSPGTRGFAPNGFANKVTDMDSFVRGLCAELDIAINDCIIVAHSVAAVVASTWIHDYNPGIRAAVLATPAFRVRLYVPFALPMLGILNRIKPQAKITSYVTGKLLTHDAEKAQEYDNDPIICKDISNRILTEMSAAARRVIADAHTIETPILMLQASSDWVVDNTVQDAFFKNLASSCKQRHDIHGAYHAVFHECSRASTIQVVKQFITERWAVDNHHGATNGDTDALITAVNIARAKKLHTPLSPLNPKYWFFKCNRLAMRFPGSLSRGIAISWQHGFDSGSSLDHVYLNKSVGFTPIGRFIDRIYLDSIGWRGIRRRAENMQLALHAAADIQMTAHEKIQLVDIASGPGRYVFDFVQAYSKPIEALCRDRDPQGLIEGREIARSHNCSNIRYEQGDAFDSDSLATLAGSANIIVASGVYELFGDNELIERSIRGIHGALPEDGCFIYTNQTWHPQLEFIARVLKNRDGDPWVMRCRPQAEIDNMVRRIGFQKMRTYSDPWGIFTVSIARKVT